MAINPVAASQAHLAQSVNKAQEDAALVQAATRTQQGANGLSQANNGIKPTVESAGPTVNGQGQVVGSRLNVKA